MNPPLKRPAAPRIQSRTIDIDSWQYLLANSDNNIGKYSPQVVAVEETAQYFDERAVDASSELLARSPRGGLFAVYHGLLQAIFVAGIHL